MNQIGIMRGQIEYPVTEEKKMNVLWRNNETQRTKYTKCAFHPLNIVLMLREYTEAFQEKIGNKRLYNHRHSFSNL